MALVNCPECDGQVSDQAAMCPHCGYPIRGGYGYEYRSERRLLNSSDLSRLWHPDVHHR